MLVNEIYEDGAAAKDGRLLVGDQIVEVCKGSLLLFCESLFYFGFGCN